MSRHKDIDWDVPESAHTWSNVPIYLLMDIRDELKEMNVSLRALRCTNFLRIPRALDRIEVNTRKRKKKPVTKGLAA